MAKAAVKYSGAASGFFGHLQTLQTTNPGFVQAGFLLYMFLRIRIFERARAEIHEIHIALKIYVVATY